MNEIIKVLLESFIRKWNVDTSTVNMGSLNKFNDRERLEYIKRYIRFDQFDWND